MREQVRQTSIDSFREMQKTNRLSKGQRAVFDALKIARRPHTGREIAQYLEMDGAWKRLPELERQGRARRVGTKCCEVTNKTATAWVLGR